LQIVLRFYKIVTRLNFTNKIFFLVLYFSALAIYKNAYALTMTDPDHHRSDKNIVIAQEPDTSDNKWIQSVTVSANQKNNKSKNESLSIELIRDEFIKENKSGSLMQTLNKIPGVQSMDIGSGISKPMIRGLGFYRVIVAENGIRSEGQHWSMHHGLAIDQQSVEHVEIVKGPSSLRFGADGLGGTLNVLPYHVPFNDGISAEISLTGRSNNNWFGQSGNISYKNKTCYVHATFSRMSYGDFNVPKTDSFLLPAPVSAIEASHKVKMDQSVYNTAGNETSASFTIGILKRWGNSYLESAFNQNEFGFFDWEGTKYDSIRYLHSKSNRDILLPKQNNTNLSLRHFTNIYINKNKLEIALGFQDNNSLEYSNITDKTGNRKDDLQFFRNKGYLDIALKLTTYTLNSNYNIQSFNKHNINIGFNNQLQKHNQDGYGFILPNYEKYSGGIYAIHRYTITDKWQFNEGLRLDNINCGIEETIHPDPQSGDSLLNKQINTSFTFLTFTGGFVYTINQISLLKLNLGTGNRAPSVYELSAYGLHRHDGRFEKGDPALKKENSIQFDMGYEINHPSIQISISPFVNYFFNYLYVSPTSELRSEGQVYEYRNTKAILTGGEFSAKAEITKHLSLHLSGEYVYAVNLSEMSALPFTPPLSVTNEIQYSINKNRLFQKTKLSFESIWVASQEYTVPNELSTPGYQTFNFLAAGNILSEKNKWDIVLRVQNIFDNKYYDHISFYRRMRIPSLGRNIQISLIYSFNKN